MLKHGLVFLCLTSSAAIKWYAYLLTRKLPFALVYGPKLIALTAIYLTSCAALLASRRDGLGKTHWRDRLLGLNGVPRKRRGGVWWLLGLLVTLAGPLCTLDMIYRAHIFHPSDGLSFARVGHVTETTAALIARMPDTDQSSTAGLTYWPVGSDGGHSDAQSRAVRFPLAELDPHEDGVYTAHLTGLEPNTTYAYAFERAEVSSATSHLSGHFATRLRASKLDTFRIVSSSCLKPGWPYSPAQHALRIRGLEHLHDFIALSGRRVEAMLFLGDFIYSDLPMPLAPYTRKYFTQLYRQVYASPSWTPLLRSVPWVHMYDDHEIVNDFAPSSPERVALQEQALGPFRSYQLSVHPPPVEPSQPTYTAFNIGDVAFFVLDNRSFRDEQPFRPGCNSTAGFGARTMLGERQLAQLKEWVEREDGEGRLLVLVSGVPFTRNWSEGSDEVDSWGGYLEEREKILEMLWAVGGAVIISGDRHEHATTLFPPPPTSPHPASSAIIEFSTSPLSFFHQPWLREYVPHPPTDLPIHLHWRGHTKFGVFDFDTAGETRAVDFSLVADGEVAWRYRWVKGEGVEVPEWTGS